MKLHEAETEKFNIKQMKDLFEQKAAQLATEIVGKGRLGLATFFFSFFLKGNCFKRQLISICVSFQISSHAMMRRRA